MDSSLSQSLIVAGGSSASTAVIIRLANHVLLTFRYIINWSILLPLGILSSAFTHIAEPISSTFGVTIRAVVMAADVSVLLAIYIQSSIQH